jgi:hypothetical protein
MVAKVVIELLVDQEITMVVVAVVEQVPQVAIMFSMQVVLEEMELHLQFQVHQ